MFSGPANAEDSPPRKKLCSVQREFIRVNAHKTPMQILDDIPGKDNITLKLVRFSYSVVFGCHNILQVQQYKSGYRKKNPMNTVASIREILKNNQ